MRSKLLNADPPVTYAVALETDEEVVATLTRFLATAEVDTASLTAIGAFRDAVLGYFDWQSKSYVKIPVGQARRATRFAQGSARSGRQLHRAR
jgi:uncharacterized protein